MSLTCPDDPTLSEPIGTFQTATKATAIRPTYEEFRNFRMTISRHTMLHEQLTRFYTGYRRDAPPMAIMFGDVGALSAFFYDSMDINNPEHRIISAHRMLAKMATIAAIAYKYSVGQPFIYPRNDLDYASNFLHMCFAVPCEPFIVNPVVARALDRIFTRIMGRMPRRRPSDWRDPRAPILSHASPPVWPASGAQHWAVRKLPFTRCLMKLARMIALLRLLPGRRMRLAECRLLALVTASISLATRGRKCCSGSVTSYSMRSVNETIPSYA